jgi:ACR3 family arsenite transporter
VALILPHVVKEDKVSNEKKVSGIGFFEKYLTLWVILCMVIGVLMGKYLGFIPEFLNRF